MKAHIASIANNLAATIDYDAINVTMICKAANVSRQTYYRYFEDKLDIALWQRRVLLSDYFYKFSSIIGWSETLKMILENNDSGDNLMKGIAWSKDNPRYLKASEELFKEFFEDELRARNCTITEEIEFQMDACAYVVCKILDNWCKSNMKLPPGQLIRYLDGIMPAKIKSQLELPVVSGTKHLL
jgi:AcrR family transcriptional regulator